MGTPGYGTNLVLGLFRCKFCDLSFINLFVLFDPQTCNVSKELSYRSCEMEGMGIAACWKCKSIKLDLLCGSVLKSRQADYL